MSFLAGFPTLKGGWSEVRIPFERFVGTWRARELPDKVFDTARIRRLGLLLADKRQGRFDLQLVVILSVQGGKIRIDRTSFDQWDRAFVAFEVELDEAEFDEAEGIPEQADEAAVVEGAVEVLGEVEAFPSQPVGGHWRSVVHGAAAVERLEPAEDADGEPHAVGTAGGMRTAAEGT